jgi:hypothetical protein
MRRSVEPLSQAQSDLDAFIRETVTPSSVPAEVERQEGRREEARGWREADQS